MKVRLWILISTSFGYGVLQFPLSRNANTPASTAAGAFGDRACGDGAGSEWYTGSAGPSLLESKFTTDFTTLYSGGILEIGYFVASTPGGVFRLELCVNPEQEISDDCFTPLNRDPTYQEYSPYIKEEPTLSVMMETKCIYNFNPNRLIRERYIIPAGLASDHGLIRWVWATARDCCPNSVCCEEEAPKAVKEFRIPVDGMECELQLATNVNCVKGTCPGEDCQLMQVKNCADVQVVTGSSSDIVTPEGHLNDCGATLTTGIAECRERLRGKLPENNDACKELCDDKASWPIIWCQEVNQCTLLDCMAAWSLEVCESPST